MIDQERLDAIQGLRDLADFLEQHPGVPFPFHNTLNSAVETKEELARIARLASWKKDYGGEYFSLRKSFAGNLTLDVFAHRSVVCRKVVTGTKLIPAQPEREVEEIDWVCDDAALLASGPHHDGGGV